MTISKMYIAEDGPISASKLSEKSGSGTSWLVGGSSFENLANDNVIHESFDKINPSLCSDAEECIDIVQKMNDSIKGATLPASESDTIGRIVIITCETTTTGLPTIETCVDALGLKSNVSGYNLIAESTITSKDWSKCAKYGFCFEDDDEVDDGIIEEDEESSDQSKIIATTKIMASELTDHFEYNMSGNIVCAPVLYGGRINGSTSFIAVLSMRVWT
jgi:hypothetical protein